MKIRELIQKTGMNKINPSGARLNDISTRITGLLLLAALIGGIVYGITEVPGLPWHKKPVQAGAIAADIRTIVIESRDVRDTINCLGQIVFREKASISSKVSGRLAKVYVKEGQRVRRGEVIAKLAAGRILKTAVRKFHDEE